VLDSGPPTVTGRPPSAKLSPWLKPLVTPLSTKSGPRRGTIRSASFPRKV